MTEFLVRVEGQSRYVRVIADTVLEVVAVLGADAKFTVFSSSGAAYRLEANQAPQSIPARLPLIVRLAWWGAQHPWVRLAFQVACWLSLAVSFAQTATRVPGWPMWLLIAGLANTLAWWWFESERGRIDPEVRIASDP